MWFIDWFIDCSCVEHSNLYVKADNYKKVFDEYSSIEFMNVHQAGVNQAQLLSPVSAMFHLALEQWELK